jgi:hypothetical protein
MDGAEMPRMRSRARRKSALFVLLALCLAWRAVEASTLREGPLRAYLPADGASPGWARDGEPQEFEGGDLYIYIDGGAEIYEEYGFARVIVQDYKNAQGRSVSLEIFEMTTPAAAFGMFTFKRSGKGRATGLGRAAELDDYYLNFWKGRFLVTVTGFDESEETINGILSVGRTVDAKLPEGGVEPGLVGALPAEGLESGSVKYLKGLLGLANVYSFYTARGLAFRDAVRGLYEGGTALIVLDYGSADARRAAWLDLNAALEGSKRFEKPQRTRTEAALLRDGKGQFIAIGESGPRLLVGLAATAEAAIAIAARAR